MIDSVHASAVTARVAAVGPFDGPADLVVFLLLALGVVIGPYVLYLALGQLGLAYRIFASDPIDAATVRSAEGVVEVEGVARKLEETLTGTYSNEPAFAYTWKKKRRETETDAEGNEETSWETISQGDTAVPFAVEDDSGTVAVDPGGANLTIDESRQDGDSGWFGSGSRYRKYEGRIGPGDSVHVYGQKRTSAPDEDSPGDEPYYIGGGDAVSEFVVSDVSELRTVLRYLGIALLLLVGALLWIPVAIGAFLHQIEATFGVPVWSPIEDLLPLVLAGF